MSKVTLDGDLLTIDNQLIVNVPLSIQYNDIDKTMVEGLWDYTQQIIEENKRFRTALTFYAEEDHLYDSLENWGWDTVSGERFTDDWKPEKKFLT